MGFDLDGAEILLQPLPGLFSVWRLNPGCASRPRANGWASLRDETKPEGQAPSESASESESQHLDADTDSDPDANHPVVQCFKGLRRQRTSVNRTGTSTRRGFSTGGTQSGPLVSWTQPRREN